MGMWKKKPTASDFREFMRDETEWPGKKPKAPKTLKGCLADLIKDSTSWLRKCPDVWFHRYEKAYIVGQRELGNPGRTHRVMRRSHRRCPMGSWLCKTCRRRTQGRAKH